MRAPIMAALFAASVVFAACGDGGSAGSTGSGGAGSTSTGGSGGSAPEKPIVWKALPSAGAPSARSHHTAVWTGSKMIVWGGYVQGKPSVTGTGALYDPAARTWSPTSMTGAPSPRHSHAAVWLSGINKMAVWGGYGVSAYAPDGGLYDPATDTWTPMSTSGQPSPRTAHTATWTGGRLVIWGGLVDTNPQGDGGIYDPMTDAWTPVSAAGQLSPRFSLSAAFTGEQILFWGGSNFIDWQNSGAFFNPASAKGGAWGAMTATDGAPDRREGHTGVWTGAEMLIWGGWTGGPYINTGALFTPAMPLGSGGAWKAMSTEGAPEGRGEHVAVWTGHELFVWGGCGGDSCGKVFGDGGRYRPDASGGTWSAVASQAALGPRRGATGVLAGTSILVWGGLSAPNQPLADGAESEL